MMQVRIAKTITVEVTQEMVDKNLHNLMFALDVPFTAKMSSPQAPRPGINGFISWSWEEITEVNL